MYSLSFEFLMLPSSGSHTMFWNKLVIDWLGRS